MLAGLAVPLLGEAESEARKQRNKQSRHHDRDHRAGKQQDHAGHGVDAEKKKKKKKKCKAPTTKCGKTCFNLQTDRANCGACGKVCAASESCRGGTCTCDGALCAGCCAGGVCQPGTSDQQCGAGGAACAACPSGTSCAGGVCDCGGSGACDAGETCCGTTCVDAQTDFDNCDGCGLACNSQKADTCSGGTCMCGVFAACGANEQCCGGQCVNTTTPDNCDASGNVCPGYMKANDNVTCQNGTTCTFTCQGDHWDVNGNPTDGCEATYTFANHTQATATPIGNVSCNDGSGGTTPSRTFYSDARTHETPAVPGFDAASGSAPHWWSINATGGLCQNDLDVKLTMTGATGNCYKLSVVTDKGTYTAQTSSGVAQIVKPMGSYSDDTSVYFKVEKTCGTNVREAPTYTITYHL